MLPGFGGYVSRNIPLVNIAPNRSFVKAALCEIKLGLGVGCRILSRWHKGNKSHSSQTSVTSKTRPSAFLVTSQLAAGRADLPFFPRQFVLTQSVVFSLGTQEAFEKERICSLVGEC